LAADRGDFGREGLEAVAGMPKPFYVAPLTGAENHVSANELLRDRVTKNNMDRHKQRLQNMKPSVDNKPPATSQMKHLQTNRKKKELEFQRYSDIERENFRLLDKMSKIMVRNAANSVFGVHSSINCPALDGEKARTRKTKVLLEENQVMLRRILQTKPYYSSVEWTRHTDKTDGLMHHMCRYPVRLSKSSMHRPESTTMLDQSSMSEASVGSKTSGAGGVPGRKRLGSTHSRASAGSAAKHGSRDGAVSAPPVVSADRDGDAQGYGDDDFEAEETGESPAKIVPAAAKKAPAMAAEQVDEVAEEEDNAEYADESFEAD
jgi:hypothetical protein